MRVLSDLNIATMLEDFSGYAWERVSGGWYDSETGTVFSEAQILEILATTTLQLAGAQ